ncbi:MAG TPA: serine hydrolase domain-containing protein [Vicinamibacterales bacterium]|nr:serine hydrolase domain-containing protein [Vicinamibacterales bacterium]
MGDTSVGRLVSRIERAILSRVTPAAIIEVGRADEVLWSRAFGRLTYDADAAPCRPDTVFDLASLTKVLVTVPLVMRALTANHLSLATPVAALVPSWRGADRAGVTVGHLLDHSSGLPAHDRLWARLATPDEVEPAIATLPLTHPPGARAVYSDLGFILLGRALERLGGGALPVLFEALGWPRGLALGFVPAMVDWPAIAPTEFDTWRGRWLQGEVHDENTALLGGVAGHAGLFGTAAAVGVYARLVLETFRRRTALGDPAQIATMAARSVVPGSSRALGWDTMLPTSSCGTRMSARAIGHTGYTGTSLWIDPGHEAYVVLLTNRVHPTREGSGIQALRADVHDLAMETFFGVG